MHRLTRTLAAAILIALPAVVFSGQAPSGDEPGAKNLVPRPGFEASETSLRTSWQPHGAGYAVDRTEKHAGNQSLRLEATGEGEGAVAACTLPAAKIKAPVTLVASGWSKAKDVSGTPDGHYSLYVDVNYADGTNLYGPNVPFSTGTHDWEYRSLSIPLAKPVARLTVYLLLRGSHRGTAWFDDIFVGPQADAGPRYEGSPLAYTPPPQVEKARRAVVVLRDKSRRLAGRIEAAEARSIDVACQKVSLTVARLFSDFLAKDAALEVPDYPHDMIDYSILGREETLKRIRDLPGFEARETEKILDRAIAETERLLANPALAISVPPGGLRHVTVQDGAFSSDGRPLFISGILGAPFAPGEPERLELLKSLGANLLGPISVPHTVSRGWDEFDDSYFEKHVFPIYRAAAAKGFLVNPAMWNYRAPAWLAKIAPDLDLEEDKGWFRDNMDLDNPLTERFNRMWFKYAAARLKTMPNNFCYSLMGEEWCDPNFRGKHTAARYERWLEAKHGDIDRLNRAWGTAYSSLREAAAKESQKTKGGHYDWLAFNEHRLTAFNQWQIDGIKASEPDGLWTCWPAAGCLVSAPLGGFDPPYGRNREDILRQSSVSGWDGGVFAVEAGPSTRRLPESHWAKYSLGWRDEMIYYDFAKSLSPEKPVFDPELHTITSVYHISPLGVSADYFRTTLWMEHLHGLGAHLLWWWGRNADGTPRFGEFLGGFLTQPQLVEAWGRTVLELRRLTDYVALFPQLERKARILYSEPSAIHDSKSYPLAVRDAYEAMYFLDHPVGFVTERMIGEDRLADCKLLVIPAAKHASDRAVEKIRQYREKGGRVVVIGKEAFTCDEYGKPREAADFQRADIPLHGSTPEEYAPQLDRLLDEVGIQRPIRAAGKDGKRVWGVELRAARKADKWVVSLINVTCRPVEIVITTPAAVSHGRDLVANQPVAIDRLLRLDPRHPMLLELW